MPMLVGGLVAILGVGAAVGIVLALGNNEPSPTPENIFSAAPSVDLRTPGPVVSIAPIPTTGPVATVVPTQAPVQTQGPAPTAAAGETKIVRTSSVSIVVPADWEPDVEETGFSVMPPVGGFLYLESGALKSPATASEILQSNLAWFKENYPDVEICGAEKDVNLPNGPAAKQIILCYTSKTSSGKTFKATALIMASTAESGADTILFYLELWTPDEIAKVVVDAIKPALPSIQWALYQGE